MATKEKMIKFFTVVGYARIGGCIENNHYTEVFKTRAQAAKLVAEEINEYINQEGIETDYVTAKDCMHGQDVYAYNDADDKLELDIVEHKVPADFFG